jgi:adenylate kinase
MEAAVSTRILLIGPPGVGKGTQASRLQSMLGAKPLASGDIFRAHIREGSELGHLAKQYMDRGELVPDEVTIKMMRGLLLESQVREKGFILDGFPRTVAQAEALEALLGELQMPLESVFLLEVEDEVVVGRLGGRLTCLNCGEVFHVSNRPPKVADTCDKCGSPLTVRVDDRPETIRERLLVYHRNTEPVVDFYRNKGLLRRIDGSASPDDVLQSILSQLPVPR